MKLKIGTLIIVAVLAGCATRKNTANSAFATAPNIMEARVNWLKDKDADKYDFNLSLRNETEKPLIIYLSDIECMKGSLRGEVRHTFFNTGERTIDFRPGEMKKFNMFCQLPNDIEAKDFKITVKRISEDQSGTGVVAGKVLYRNLTVPVTL